MGARLWAQAGGGGDLLIVPGHAPAWAEDRERLWNAAEAAERRRDSVVAQEWELALPAELDRAGRLELAEAFTSALVERYGVATDVAIHTPRREGDQRNWHAHVLTTTRRLEAEGLGAKTKALDARATGGLATVAAGARTRPDRPRAGRLTPSFFMLP